MNSTAPSEQLIKAAVEKGENTASHRAKLALTDKNQKNLVEPLMIAAKTAAVGVGIAAGVTGAVFGGPFSVAAIILVIAIYSQKQKNDEFTNIVYYLAEEILQFEKCDNLMQRMAQEYEIPYSNSTLTTVMTKLLGTILEFLPTKTFEIYKKTYAEYGVDVNGYLTNYESVIDTEAQTRTDGKVKSLLRYLDTKKLYRMFRKGFSANELYRHAIRDIIIANIFFSIAMSEFDLAYKLMAVERSDDFTRKHANVMESAEAKRFMTNLMLKRNLNLIGSTKAFTPSPEKIVAKYREILDQTNPAIFETALSKTVDAYEKADENATDSDSSSFGGTKKRVPKKRKRFTKKNLGKNYIYL